MADRFRWDEGCAIEVLDLEDGTIYALQPQASPRATVPERLRDRDAQSLSTLESRGALPEGPATTGVQVTPALLLDASVSEPLDDVTTDAASVGSTQTLFAVFSAGNRLRGIYRITRWAPYTLAIVLAIEAVWVVYHFLNDRWAATPSGISVPAAPAVERSAPSQVPPAYRDGPPLSPAPGSLEVVLAFPVQVFENGRLLGTSGDIIALAPGLHRLELVSESRRYRGEHRVVISEGRMTTLAPLVPNR